MRQALTIAVIAIGAFLLGTLMPQSPVSVEKETVVEYRYRYYSRPDVGMVTDLDIPAVRGVPSVLYIPETEVRVEYRDSIRYVALDREYKLLENPDVKIWYSGIDPTIDSLQVKTSAVIQKEPWKRHSISLSGEVGFNMLGAGAEYEYSIFRWLSVSANAGYDFYMKQPYISASAKFRLYSW